MTNDDTIPYISVVGSSTKRIGWSQTWFLRNLTIVCALSSYLNKLNLYVGINEPIYDFQLSDLTRKYEIRNSMAVFWHIDRPQYWNKTSNTRTEIILRYHN